MNIFYSNDINNSTIVLKDEEFKHCIKSLRKRLGDHIICTDGAGKQFATELSDIKKSYCELEIKEVINHPKREAYLSMAVAPTKNMARFEWFVEKSVELGIEEIYPIICKNSERRRVRVDRLNKIALSAMKQSQRWYLPKIHDVINLQDLVKSESFDVKLIAHYVADSKHLKDMINPNQKYLMLIGPEGDFTNGEMTGLMDSGFAQCNLSNNRLRTETAALVACNIINLANQ